MINFRFILLGALVGILSTIGFQELSNRYQPSSPWFGTTTEAPEPEHNTKNISSGSFLGTRSLDERDEDYVIVPRDHPLQQMRITKQTAVNSTNHIEYLYGKDDGFPVYIKTMSNEVVRVDGSYHNLHQQEGKKFIIRGGDKLEVDFSDIDHLTLTPLLDQESGPTEQQYSEMDLQNLQMEDAPSGITPMPIPLTQELDDELIKEGILPPREK